MRRGLLSIFEAIAGRRQSSRYPAEHFPLMFFIARWCERGTAKKLSQCAASLMPWKRCVHLVPATCLFFCRPNAISVRPRTSFADEIYCAGNRKLCRFMRAFLQPNRIACFDLMEVGGLCSRRMLPNRHLPYPVFATS